MKLRSPRPVRGIPRLLAAGLALGLLPSFLSRAAEPGPEEEAPAELSIEGYGLLGNLRMKRTIQALDEDGKPRTYFPASYLEDAALIVLSRVAQDGFLKATIAADLERVDGSGLAHVFSDEAFLPLPRPLRVRRAVFRIDKGNRYFFEDISFSGLTRIPESEAVAFFRLTGLIYSAKKDRLYTPAILQQGLFSLAETLRRLGYREATATVSELSVNDETGGVSVVIAVEEGPRTLVESVEWEFDTDADTPPLADAPVPGPEQPYSDLWLQDVGLDLRHQLYDLGYAGLGFSWRIEPLTGEGEERRVRAIGEVDAGRVIFLNEVRFEGLERTRLGTVERRTGLVAGMPLNPLDLEDARQRLRRLGVFESIHYRQVLVDDLRRDVVFDLEEGKRIDVRLLLGYGSYEQLRGGIEMENFNLFGRAHRSRLKLVHSMKATNADYTYTVPEVFGERIDGSLRLFGLRREEISFTRLETGISAGLRRFIEPIDTDLALSYNFEFLGTEDSLLGPDETPADVLAATIRLDANHDRRDNPLAPRSGYRLYAETETSSSLIGANVDYQRLSFAASWHQRVVDGLWFHLGVKHGLAFAFGNNGALPVNKRFFPGGENSVRGYTEGEAAPRDADGVVVGAESVIVLNLELEQAISSQISLVGFLDSAFTAATIEEYPADEGLFSVGLGLRYNTVIGPVRLEYGHNLNPREFDPDGTLHFSIGFPF